MTNLGSYTNDFFFWSRLPHPSFHTTSLLLVTPATESSGRGQRKKTGGNFIIFHQRKFALPFFRGFSLSLLPVSVKSCYKMTVPNASTTSATHLLCLKGLVVLTRGVPLKLGIPVRGDRPKKERWKGREMKEVAKKGRSPLIGNA